MNAIRELKVKVPVSTVLAKLKEHKANHIKIYAEAKVGYVEKAKIALKARLAELEAGKVKQLRFDLSPPIKFISEYDTLIGMLEATTDTDIVLTTAEYKMIVEDSWQWKNQFLAANASYSASATMAFGPIGSADEN